jgi:hypothetical protein
VSCSYRSELKASSSIENLQTSLRQIGRGGEAMSTQRKTAQFKNTKILAGKVRRKTVTVRPPVRSKKGVSLAMKNRIWHNWLTEENYL